MLLTGDKGELSASAVIAEIGGAAYVRDAERFENHAGTGLFESSSRKRT